MRIDLRMRRFSPRATMIYQDISELPWSFLFYSSISKADVLNVWIIIMIWDFVIPISNASVYNQDFGS